MEKILEIPWVIPDNKWIEHKFVVECGVSWISRQEIVIQWRNTMSCIEFLMSYPESQYNQIYKTYQIYNPNEDH